MGGIGFILFGILLTLFGLKKIPLSKDPEKNSEWLSRYGIFLTIGGPCLMVIGLLSLIM